MYDESRNLGRRHSKALDSGNRMIAGGEGERERPKESGGG